MGLETAMPTYGSFSDASGDEIITLLPLGPCKTIVLQFRSRFSLASSTVPREFAWGDRGVAVRLGVLTTMAKEGLRHSHWSRTCSELQGHSGDAAGADTC